MKILQISLLQLRPHPFLASKVQSWQLRGTCPSTRGLVQHGPSPWIYHNCLRAENIWDTTANSYTFWTPCLACYQEGGRHSSTRDKGDLPHHPGSSKMAISCCISTRCSCYGTSWHIKTSRWQVCKGDFSQQPGSSMMAISCCVFTRCSCYGTSWQIKTSMWQNWQRRPSSTTRVIFDGYKLWHFHSHGAVAMEPVGISRRVCDKFCKGDLPQQPGSSMMAISCCIFTRCSCCETA